MAVRTVVFYYILAEQNLSQLKPTNTMKRSIFLLICFCVLGFTVNYGVLCGTDTPPINPQD